MIRHNAKTHEFFGYRAGRSEFCDLCGFPAAEHRIENHSILKDYLTADNQTVGRIVERKRDGRCFFEILQWMKRIGWHPLTVGEQSGLFCDAEDRFHSWKRMQQRWEAATEREKRSL